MSETVLYTAPGAFTGEEGVSPFGLLVRDGKILGAGKPGELEKQRYDRRVDLEGWLSPGFIDCHVHLLNPKEGDPPLTSPDPEGRFAEMIAWAAGNASRLLRAGVVACRDLGSLKGSVVGLREAVKQGFIPGPRILACGPALCATGGHGGDGICEEYDGIDGVRRGVRSIVKRGADLIKLMASGGIGSPGPEPGPCELTPEEIAEVIKTARSLGRKSAAHAQGNAAIRCCVEAGIDSIEHGVFLSEDLMDLMARRRTFLVPTLSAPYYAAEEGLRREPDNRDHQRSRDIIKRHREALRKAAARGVPIACGSDAGCPFNPFEKTPYEMVLMTEAGLSPEEALRAATINAAELLGIRDDLGSLEEGKEASFLCLAKNPLEDIGAVTRVTKIFLGGKELNPNG
jgi:imidazolonepropionase-like amidohydrolase